MTVDELAQEIRRVDGENKLGAGALAEALMPFLQYSSEVVASGGKFPKQDAVERIILRRLRAEEIDGYTLAMAYEIAAIFADGAKP